MDIGADELVADVLYQIGALDGFARAAGTRVRYVKPHGALYNVSADDADQAEAIAAAVAAYDPALALLGLPGSALAGAADAAGVRFVAEAFADRAYLPDGRLVRRTEPGAVLTDPDAVAQRAVRLATDGLVTACDGTDVGVRPRSVCVHGDTPGAADLARAVRSALIAAGVELRPFA
jgi:UPF0271 protein